jgi:hypothetical protein
MGIMIRREMETATRSPAPNRDARLTTAATLVAILKCLTTTIIIITTVITINNNSSSSNNNVPNTRNVL